MRTNETVRHLNVTGTLRLRTGADLKVKNADGTEKTISLTELASLDNLTATAAELNTAADVSGWAVVDPGCRCVVNGCGSLDFCTTCAVV